MDTVAVMKDRDCNTHTHTHTLLKSITLTTFFYLCLNWCMQQSVKHCAQHTVKTSWRLPSPRSNFLDSVARQGEPRDLPRQCVCVCEMTWRQPHKTHTNSHMRITRSKHRNRHTCRYKEPIRRPLQTVIICKTATLYACRLTSYTKNTESINRQWTNQVQRYGQSAQITTHHSHNYTTRYQRITSARNQVQLIPPHTENVELG